MVVSQEPDICFPAVGKKVLIVGAGTAGLMLALELKRQGIESSILERRDLGPTPGDFIVLGPSAIRSFRHWPLLKAEYDSVSYLGVEAYFHKHSGKRVIGPRPLKPTVGRPMTRNNLQALLERAVQRQGILIRYSAKVISYFEDDSCGGVVLENGERLTADLVVACDGVQTRSWEIITGHQKVPISSGHAIYRTAFDVKPIFDAHPELEERFKCKDGKPYMQWFSGHLSHGIVFNDGKTICYSIDHLENADTSTESWTARLNSKVVANQIRAHASDWDPLLLSLVENTPENTINDWLLMLRDPEPNWVSPKARVTQAGDSAHAFLPTSANGATQAIEDSVTLAAALRFGLDRGVSQKEILQVYNEIRFPRTSCAQFSGVVTRQVHHQTDWDAVEKNPQILADAGPGKWLAIHDAEDYLNFHFDECLRCVHKNVQFLNTNLPPGYTYEPWTCQKVFEIERRGVQLRPAGDWQ